MWAFPEFEANKLLAWSGFGMAEDGHVFESLAGGCGGGKPGALDEPWGRMMGDTTSLFVVEVGEIWHLSGDRLAMEARWPAVARAVGWMLANANVTGLPRYLETTYDHFGFGGHESVVYNAAIFLAAMGYAAEMASALGEDGVAEAAAAALSRANAAMTIVLWNSTLGYYRAFNGGDAIFTDSLYGLMIAYAGGQGLAGVDAGMVAAHLAFEWERNEDAFGMRVISNPVMEDSVWMNGPPTSTYLVLAQLADASPGACTPAPANDVVDLAAALEPMRRMVVNYRDRLSDLWNLRALTHTETQGTARERGGPREQGHYGFMLTDLYLLPLLSGMQARLHEGALAFRPIFAPPYALPGERPFATIAREHARTHPHREPLRHALSLVTNDSAAARHGGRARGRHGRRPHAARCLRSNQPARWRAQREWGGLRRRRRPRAWRRTELVAGLTR